MISNERPSPYGHHKPYGSPKPPVNEDTLRAEKVGIYRGDVDVCEGTQFITAMAQTVVKEKQ